MALSEKLLDVVLTHPCPHCGHKLKQRGSWFQVRRQQYECPSCHHMVPMGYSDKVALFKKYDRREAIGQFPAVAQDGRDVVR
jgi:predicted RNA-binding Zn-ribbon protein involved in translation (DUF1610 family)